MGRPVKVSEAEYQELLATSEFEGITLQSALAHELAKARRSDEYRSSVEPEAERQTTWATVLMLAAVGVLFVVLWMKWVEGREERPHRASWLAVPRIQ